MCASTSWTPLNADTAPRRVRVARIGKPFGVRGQVTVQVFTDEPEDRFAAGQILSFDESGERPIEVVSSARHGTRWVLTLAGTADRTAAEGLRGEELFAGAVAAEASDEWFDWQLVGLPCRTPDGRELGVVRSVDHAPAHDLLVVITPDGRQVQVPFVSALVPQVDESGVVVTPPGGLFDGEVPAEADDDTSEADR